MTEEETRHTTLRDYLATLRRRRRAIILITLSGVLVALAISVLQTKTYTATASLRVKDLGESLSLAGLLPQSGDLPSATAAQGAVTVTSPSVLTRVRKDLGLKETNDELKSRLSATQDVQSNLITVAAKAPTADRAATLANAATEAAVTDTTLKARAQYADLAKQVRAKAGTLAAGAKTSPETAARQAALIKQATNLEAVSTVADLADVATRASPPSSPSSPKPIRNGILGGIVGLFIGLVAAGVLESLDRRLRRPDEVQEQLGLPVVGILPNTAMGGVPISGTPAEEHVAAMDAFRMMRTNVGFLGGAEESPRTVLVTSPLPEEGKTTVAVGLALAAAAAGERVLLVEADFHRPVHAERLGLEPGPGLADYLAGDAKPRDILQVRKFVDPAVAAQNGESSQEPAVACITAGSRERWSGEMLNSGAFSKFLGQVGKVYDLVVIDSGPLLAVADPLQIVPHVDTIVYCVRLGRTTRDQARIGKESLDRLPERLTGLVTTGVTASESGGYSYYAYAYSYRFGHGADAGLEKGKSPAEASTDDG